MLQYVTLAWRTAGRQTSYDSGHMAEQVWQLTAGRHTSYDSWHMAGQVWQLLKWQFSIQGFCLYSRNYTAIQLLRFKLHWKSDAMFLFMLRIKPSGCPYCILYLLIGLLQQGSFPSCPKFHGLKSWNVWNLTANSSSVLHDLKQQVINKTMENTTCQEHGPETHEFAANTWDFLTVNAWRMFYHVFLVDFSLLNLYYIFTYKSK